MATSHILGFPRIGKKRETKKAVEKYWKSEIQQTELIKSGSEIRKANWQVQKDAGLDYITTCDFAWYDHILDLSVTLGCIPTRFKNANNEINLDTMFRMARGRAPSGTDAPACEMTKWFDTNYHYIVPEFEDNQTFKLSSDKYFQETQEAIDLGYKVKPVIIGPISYLWLGKYKGSNKSFNKLDLLNNLLEAYGEVINKFKSQGVEWVQIDEPILGLDLPQEYKNAFEHAYNKLSLGKVKLLLTTYFNGLEDNLSTAINLPTEGLHIDLVRDEKQLTTIIDKLPSYKTLSCGIIDGRNIWKNDLNKSFKTLNELKSQLGERLWIAPSCSLLHVPVDLELETKLDPEIKQWLSFATQKIKETVTLTKGINQGIESIQQELDNCKKIIDSKAVSNKINNQNVKDRIAALNDSFFNRKNSYKTRNLEQINNLNLPKFPTTTIGSFPQTTEIRNTRKKFKNNEITKEQYEDFLKSEIKLVIDEQEKLGLDVLVHGEPERNDMVEYFGELLDGFAFTSFGWVQSYGSRCVKPPVIYGDVSRKQPMTVEWSKYANSLSKKHVKGMLTGPVTILCWSFVRDDQPRKTTANQIALALRDEIKDLEDNGINIIQIDEPAFREGLPLRTRQQLEYLDYAVKAFKLSTSGVENKTQIHTHMCYSEFNELIEYIAAMDADVISIEASRSDMEILQAFEDFSYPNEIGLGVYDIHSPLVPQTDKIVNTLTSAATKIPAKQLWVNPDCGLKTRNWEETRHALANMVEAANIARKKA